jgi:hypothetical protein
MSGLDQIQIGFENLLKNGFEKLEKGKRKRNSFCLGRFSYRSPTLRPTAAAQSSSFSLPRARVRSSGPSPIATWRPVIARTSESRVEPLTAADLPGPPVSDCLPFPFFFLRPNTAFSFFTDSVIRIRRKSTHLPCFLTPTGYKTGTPR